MLGQTWHAIQGPYPDPAEISITVGAGGGAARISADRMVELDRTIEGFAKEWDGGQTTIWFKPNATKHYRVEGLRSVHRQGEAQINIMEALRPIPGGQSNSSALLAGIDPRFAIVAAILVGGGYYYSQQS